MAVKYEGWSIGDLISKLSRESSSLLSQEIQLAKVELSQKATQAGNHMVWVVMGGAIAYAGFLAMLAAAILGLSYLMAGWLAALLVGVVVAGIGFFLLQMGINALKNINPAPEYTIESLKENGKWMKEQLS